MKNELVKNDVEYNKAIRPVSEEYCIPKLPFIYPTDPKDKEKNQ
jgi:hypothetical protein